MEDRGWRTLRRALAATGDLVLPSRCGGCGGPGGPWCRECRIDLRAAAGLGGALTVGAGGRGLVVWSAAAFEGALRTAVSAWKDEGRHDLRPRLAALLAGALSTALLADPVLRAAVSGGGAVLVVPVPASPGARRRRGGDPVGDLSRRAVAAVRGPPTGRPGVVHLPCLHHTRAVADQSRLTRRERRANLHRALAVRTQVVARLDGAVVVLVDDVVTTGATLLEAARAVRRAGASHIVAVTVAATPRVATDASAAR